MPRQNDHQLRDLKAVKRTSIQQCFFLSKFASLFSGYFDLLWLDILLVLFVGGCLKTFNPDTSLKVTKCKPKNI